MIFAKFAALIINKTFMNTYETVFIMNPVLSEDCKETVKKIMILQKKKKIKSLMKKIGVKKLNTQFKKENWLLLFD